MGESAVIRHTRRAAISGSFLAVISEAPTLDDLTLLAHRWNKEHHLPRGPPTATAGMTSAKFPGPGCECCKWAGRFRFARGFMGTTEFWLWWFTDRDSGKRRKTTYKLPRRVAVERFGEIQPVAGSMETRDSPEIREEPDSRLWWRKE